MSHFYGVVSGQARTEATRRGSKQGGLRTVAASWNGAIEVHVYNDEGVDKFSISEIPWHGCGTRRVIAHGVLGHPEEAT